MIKEINRWRVKEFIRLYLILVEIFSIYSSMESAVYLRNFIFIKKYKNNKNVKKEHLLGVGTYAY